MTTSFGSLRMNIFGKMSRGKRLYLKTKCRRDSATYVVGMHERLNFFLAQLTVSSSVLPRMVQNFVSENNMPGLVSPFPRCQWVCHGVTTPKGHVRCLYRLLVCVVLLATEEEMVWFGSIPGR